jgi:hypothetical protein
VEIEIQAQACEFILRAINLGRGSALRVKKGLLVNFNCFESHSTRHRMSRVCESMRKRTKFIALKDLG